MKRSMFIKTLFCTVTVLTLLANCSKKHDNATIPTLTTAAISDIQVNDAVSGGNISSDGGSAIVLRGVCWGTSANPTRGEGGIFTGDGAGTGTFISHLSALETNTTYYVRAYATNGAGTGYGNEISFKTN